MTPEERLKLMIGEQQFQIAMLISKLEEAENKLKEYENKEA